jgi:hypothetical protein
MPEPPNPAREMQQRYKNVFATMEGQIVLGDILTLGHFGETLNPTDPIAVAEYNAAIVIARMAGAFDPVFKQLGMIDKGE